MRPPLEWLSRRLKTSATLSCSGGLSRVDGVCRLVSCWVAQDQLDERHEPAELNQSEKPSQSRVPTEVFRKLLGSERRSQLTDELNCRRSQENDEEAGEDEEDQGQQQFHRQLGGHLRGLEILPRA